MKLTINKALSIISILGFSSIFLKSLNENLDIDPWVNVVMFALFGFVLVIAGGIRYISQYIKDGKLTMTEVTRMLSIIMGVLALITSVILMPFKFLEPLQKIPFVSGVQTIISILAIIVIVVDTWVNDLDKK